MRSAKLFLEYCFSGSDQEQEAMLITLGELVKDSLLEYGKCEIDIETMKLIIDEQGFHDWVECRREMI